MFCLLGPLSRLLRYSWLSLSLRDRQLLFYLASLVFMVFTVPAVLSTYHRLTGSSQSLAGTGDKQGTGLHGKVMKFIIQF